MRPVLSDLLYAGRPRDVYSSIGVVRDVVVAVFRYLPGPCRVYSPAAVTVQTLPLCVTAPPSDAVTEKAPCACASACSGSVTLSAAAGTLGVGVTEAGETQEQAGQAGGMSICLTHYAAHPRLILSPHVVPGRWLLQGGTTGGSGAFRWFREQCCPELTYEEMDALAERSEPLSGGLVFLPYMAGERSPLWMPEAKGVFYGLSFAATRGDMLRAVMEGTAYALRHNLDTAREAGCAVTELRASGGGAASPLWMTIKANVTGCAMSAVRAERATVRGAAMLAGVGVGAVPGWNAWKRPASGRRFEPDPALRKRYERGYERYRALIEAMIPVYMEGRNQI